MAANLKVGHHIRNPTPSIDFHFLEKQRCKIASRSVWNDGAFGFVEKRLPNKKKNKNSSDVGSVPVPKIEINNPRSLFVCNIFIIYFIYFSQVAYRAKIAPRAWFTKYCKIYHKIIVWSITSSAVSSPTSPLAKLYDFAHGPLIYFMDRG